MNKQTQLEIFDQFTAKQRAVLIGKADDYAGSTDRLNNFKVAGAVCGLNAPLNCLSLIATKVARLGSLLKDGRAPVNEAIEDSVLDLANYAFLLHCILAEGAAEPTRYRYSEAQPGGWQDDQIKHMHHEPLGEMVQGLEAAAEQLAAAGRAAGIAPLGDKIPVQRVPELPASCNRACGPSDMQDGLCKCDRIEPGDTVECVEAAGEGLLRTGSQYIVKDVDERFVSLNGYPQKHPCFFKKRFKLVKKHNA